MVAKQSEKTRKASVDLAKEPPRKLMNLIQSTIKPAQQRSMQDFLPANPDPWQQSYEPLSMPRNISWDTLNRMYNFQPDNYEELLAVQGVGPATVRGLALVAELIYGEKPSCQDPVKFSFAFGGKDGVPFPVDRKAMDQSIEILRGAVQNAKIGDKEKMRSLQRLRKCVPNPA